MHTLRIAHTHCWWHFVLYGEVRDTERTGRQKQSAVHVEANCAALSFIRLQHSSYKDDRHSSQSCGVSLVSFSVGCHFKKKRKRKKKGKSTREYSFIFVQSAHMSNVCPGVFVRRIMLSNNIWLLKSQHLLVILQKEGMQVRTIHQKTQKCCFRMDFFPLKKQFC